MSSRAARIAMGVLSCALAACTSGLRTQASAQQDGTYAFSEHAKSLPDFTGRLRVTGDSVRLLTSSPTCVDQPPIPLQPGETQAFTCGTFVLMAMRQVGRWEFQFSTERIVQDVVQKCIAFKTDGGVQQCTATTAERRDRVIPVRGALRLVRVAAPPAARSGEL